MIVVAVVLLQDDIVIPRGQDTVRTFEDALVDDRILNGVVFPAQTTLFNVGSSSYGTEDAFRIIGVEPLEDHIHLVRRCEQRL